MCVQVFLRAYSQWACCFLAGVHSVESEKLCRKLQLHEVGQARPSCWFWNDQYHQVKSGVTLQPNASTVYSQPSLSGTAAPDMTSRVAPIISSLYEMQSLFLLFSFSKEHIDKGSG